MGWGLFLRLIITGSVTMRIVLLGSARDHFILRAVEALRAVGHSVYLLVNETHSVDLSQKTGVAGTFRGMVAWWRLGTLTTITSFHPDMVVFVVGDQYQHDNVSRALRRWKQWGLLADARIGASLSHDPGEIEFIAPDEENVTSPSTPRSLALSRWDQLAIPTTTNDGDGGRRPTPLSMTIRESTPDTLPTTIRVTIDRKGRRATAIDPIENDDRPVALLLGGDRTFGIAQSDEATIGWRLQKRLPHWNIVNAGVEGYGLGDVVATIDERLGDLRPSAALIEISSESASDPHLAGHLSTLHATGRKRSCRIILVCFAPLPDDRDIANVVADFDIVTITPDDDPTSVYETALVGASCPLLDDGATTQKKSYSQLPFAFHAVTYLWGPSFTRLFLEVVLPNHLGTGLTTLAKRGRAIYTIHTTEADAATILSHASFRKLERMIPTRIVTHDHLFRQPQEGLGNELLLMTRMHRMAFDAAFHDDARLLILPPDQIYSTGTFDRLLTLALAGKNVVTVGGVRVVKESFLPELATLSGETMSLPPRALVTLMSRHLHPIIRSAFVDEVPFSTGPVHLYHRSSCGGFVSNNLHMHPLMIYPQRPVRLTEGNFDTSWLAAACPRIADYHVVTDSDEITAVEMSPEGKRVAPPGDGPFDPSRLATFYRRIGSPIHWELVEQSVRFHVGKITPDLEKTAQRGRSLVRSSLPISARWRKVLRLLWDDD